MDGSDKKSVADNFVKKIKTLLNEKKCNEAFEYLLEISDGEILDQRSWELVPTVVEFLNEDNYLNNLNVFNICEKILETVAVKCNPNETVLLFLEQVEDFENDFRFHALLNPLAKSLTKADLDKVIEWVVSTIRSYSENLPLPSNKKPSEIIVDEHGRSDKLSTKLKYQDPASKRLTTTYQSISSFLEYVINKCINLNSNHNTKISMYLLNLHLTLFGKPFSNLNISGNNELRIYESSIIQMSLLTGNLMKFLKIIEERSFKRITKSIEERRIDIDNIPSLEIQLFDVEISDLAYANFYFILTTSETLSHLIPQVYHPHYLMNTLFYLANYLIKQPEYNLLSKGLRLIAKILERLDIESVSQKYVESAVHRNLFSSLTQVMVYCDSMPERKMALDIFCNYIERFTIRARYSLIIHLYETSNHSGLLALIISILKESIIKSLDSRSPCEYFIGDKLAVILHRICKLPNGSTSDLVEISDELIAALNLLRFLILRDKSNITGIWTIIKTIKDNFLEPLREGIELSRAHWKVKINELEEKKINQHRKNEIVDDISVTVGGENLPKMPIEETIKFCYSALNALDIMECILTRTNECIETHHFYKLPNC
ncbi:glomulin [Microplitis demolitor]|uniref:glomulin n=1 Tax=Microplitis demolitor TaxID=69319 RepID=UPI00235B6805|nr:glomulin [Microplitis demolitor]